MTGERCARVPVLARVGRGRGARQRAFFWWSRKRASRRLVVFVDVLLSDACLLWLSSAMSASRRAREIDVERDLTNVFVVSADFHSAPFCDCRAQ